MLVLQNLRMRSEGMEQERVVYFGSGRTLLFNVWVWSVCPGLEHRQHNEPLETGLPLR